MRFSYPAACVVLWLGSSTVSATGQDVQREAPEAEIKSAIQSYVAAFNARDVEKVVAHWSPDGVYTSRTTGEQVVGREAMTKEFAAILADERAPTLAVATESIEFISPNVALERGMATVTRGEDDVAETSYSVVFIKRDGSWLVDRVTEDEIVTQVSHYEQLKDLAWMIGQWVDAGDGFSMDIDCQWTKNQNFISRRYTVANEDDVESSGLQIIGWDAKNKEIRSWLFDSTGGVVTGTWTKRGDKWVVQSVATLADGGSGSFTSIFQPLDDRNYSWTKVNRVLDGRLLPNLDEVVVQRK